MRRYGENKKLIAFRIEPEQHEKLKAMVNAFKEHGYCWDTPTVSSLIAGSISDFTRERVKGNKLPTERQKYDEKLKEHIAEQKRRAR